MDESFSLGGRRVLITGAASGIGRAFAELAAADDAHVGLLDIDSAGLDRTMQQLQGGGKRLAVSVDLTDPAATEAAVADVRDALGGFDAICNIAGWDVPGPFWEQPYELWQKLININLWAMLNVCRATVPDLIAQQSGTIVNVGSDAGRVGSKGETIYAAAKGGVISFTKSAAPRARTVQGDDQLRVPRSDNDPAARTGDGRQPEADREACPGHPATPRGRADRAGTCDRVLRFGRCGLLHRAAALGQWRPHDVGLSRESRTGALRPSRRRKQRRSGSVAGEAEGVRDFLAGDAGDRQSLGALQIDHRGLRAATEVAVELALEQALPAECLLKCLHP